MSMAMTLRRFAPEEAPGEVGDEAAEFALGLKGIKLIEGPELLHFFEEWHVVHYLSSGTEWGGALPAGFLIGGADWHPIHPEEEPPRILSPADVKAAATHLAALPHALLDARLAELHGDVEVFGKPSTPEDDGLIRGAFGTIRDFVAAAARHDQAILMTMT